MLSIERTEAELLYQELRHIVGGSCKMPKHLSYEKVAALLGIITNSSNVLEDIKAAGYDIGYGHALKGLDYDCYSNLNVGCHK